MENPTEGTAPTGAETDEPVVMETEVRPLTQADVLAKAARDNAQPVADRDERTTTERTLSDGHENVSTRVDH